ncbi:MAG: hypothetical protein MJ153_05075 [Clostridia bacterium]|nr:hypothetical protein [Clostridia bacterium]
MASEQVNKILEAEQKAQEIDKEARAKADSIMIEAQKRAQSAYQTALADARKQIADLYDKHKASGSDEDNAVNEADIAAAKKLRDDSSPRREEAVKAVMDILTGR